MNRLSTLLILGALLFGCAPPLEPAANVPEPAKKELERVGDYVLGEPVTEGNLTLVPISSASQEAFPRELENTITLEEAKKLGLVEIEEHPESARVERLLVRNLSDRPLLLLAGELLVGGKQDRIIAKDTVVPPKSAVEVQVYCVEHGRWHGTSTKFTYQSAVVPAKVKDAAVYGAQTQVWDEVAEFNDRAGADRSKSTVAAGLGSERVRRHLAEAAPMLVKKIAGENVVGLVFIINGEVQSMEIFGHPRIFERAKENLIRGFLAEAATRSDQTARDISKDEYIAFVKESLYSEKTVTAASANDTTLSMESEVARGRELQQRTPGGSNVLLHGTYSKQQE